LHIQGIALFLGDRLMAGGVEPEPSDEPETRTARDIARRHRDAAGKALSPVMKTAATARELACAAGRERGKSRRR
jgi:hypothetical protein